MTYFPGMAAHPETHCAFSHSPVAFEPRSAARQNSTESWRDTQTVRALLDLFVRPTEDGSIPNSSQSCIVPSILISLGSDGSFNVISVDINSYA